MARKRVIMLPSPAKVTSESWSVLKRKRKTLWHHAERNLLVARVGKICLEQDRGALKGLGIPARRKNLEGCVHRVMILVENLEHANALAGLLPGWEVLDTLSPQDAMEEPDEPGSLLASGSIMTWMYAEKVDFQANYLIRATGWRGRMGLGSWLKDHSARMVIVDFDDAWDAQAIMDTEARAQEYKEQNLEVIWNKETIAKNT